MRAGTYPTPPMAQTDAPGPTWEIPQDAQIATGRKSAGARGVESPNNAGGIGDTSGMIMLDNIISGDVKLFRKTRGARRGGFARGRRDGRGRRERVPVTKVLTAGIGEVDMRGIDVYRQRGGYRQWERAVRELKPADVLEACDKSGLRGRGGAGFPTGPKVVVFAQRTSRCAISSATATRPSRARSRITC